MSRFKRLWVLLVPMVMIAGLGAIAPAQATSTWSPPPPTPSDACGTRQDRFYIPTGAGLEDTGWSDSAGNFYSAGTWYPSNGANGVTIIATDYSSSSNSERSFPMAFDTRSDSSCVEATDTVTYEVLACNAQTNGTKVRFTYINTDDSTDWWVTFPRIGLERWDGGNSFGLVPSYGRVLDGTQLSVEGGDKTEQYATNVIAPGTYSISITTDERGTQVLSNRLFVPNCGTYKVPAGDPMGGPITPPVPPKVSKPKVSIGKCYKRKVSVQLDSRQATKTHSYRVIVDPRKGKTKTYYYSVSTGKTRKVVLKKQKKGTWIKVTVNNTTTKRKLGKC